MSKLEGAVVVLTGASSGIGRVTARRFAARKAKLVLASRSGEALEEVLRQCVELGAEAIAVPTDVRDESQVIGLRDAAVERFGRVDVWVNDAAVYMLGTLEESPTQELRNLLETNILGVVHGAKAALVQFRKQGHGTLISVGSIAGQIPYAKAAAYCASKHAIDALHGALHQELLGTGIESCLVVPATVDTPLFDHAANYTGKQMRVMHPIASPERVARAIVRTAESPKRKVRVGRAPILMSLYHLLLPWLVDRLQAKLVERRHLGPLAEPPTPGNVGHALPPYEDHGGWKRGRSSTLEPPPRSPPALVTTTSG